jgi:hypothetical protein
MSKGLKLTLMTVAVACMGMRAMAMAPVINDIPSPIVSDEEGSTQVGGLGNNDFVYPDAFNPNSFATDSDGPNPLAFSFMAQDDKYTFNGVGPLGGGDDPVDPGATNKDIIANANPAEVDLDANDATLTIRNDDLSPLGAANGGDPAGDGILPSETRIITLVASDGVSTTEADFTVYTEDNGFDRISGEEEGGEEVLNFTPAGSNAAPWLYFNEFAIGGTMTSSVNNNLCIASSAAGVNSAEWYSPYGDTDPGATEAGGVDLTANSIYRFRFNFTTNATGNLTPLFSVIIDNSDPTDPFGSLQLYNNENFRLDNLGGANGPQGSGFGVLEHDFLFTPSPVQTAEWNSASEGAFQASVDDLNDMRIRFRVFDIENAGWGGEIDTGQVCMTNVVVTKFPWDARTVTATPFDAQNLVDGSADATTPNHWTVSGLVNSTVAFSGGDVTVTPTDGNYTVEIASFFPGDTTNPVGSGGAELLDNYPLAWPSNAIYEVVAGLSAPNAAGENNPPDVFRLGIDTPTQEVITLNVTTASLQGAGMPNQGAAQLFYSIVDTGQVTLSNVSNHNRMRPRMDFICNPALSFDGITTNNGGMRAHGFTVNEITVGN